jgi:hypothetical protein
MGFARLVLPLFIGAVWLAPLPAWPQTGADAFVRSLVEAINSGNPDRRRALLHPAAATCSQPAAQAMLGDMLQRQANRPIPDKYRWKLKALSVGSPGLFGDRFQYAVAPTHHLQIDYEAGENTSHSLLLQVRFERNEWREITGCPTEATLREAAAAQVKRSEQSGRIDTLVRSIPMELREQVEQLAQSGRRIDAIKHYQAVTGEDLTISKSVIDRLTGRN